MTEKLTSAQRILAAVQMLATERAVPEWKPERIRLWVTMLSDQDPAVVERAVLTWVNEHEEWPTLAGLRHVIDAERKKANPMIGTVYEHYPVLWECAKCGDAHEGSYTERPPCPVKIEDRSATRATHERAGGGNTSRNRAEQRS